MREVRGTRRRALLRGQLESFAQRYGVALREDTPTAQPKRK
jgi:hypothetical protein